MFLRFFAAAALAVPSQLAAQTMLGAPPAPIAAPVTNRAILRTGTEVPLRLLQELTTKGKFLRVGARIRMETAEAIFVQGVNVVPTGTPAVGEITDIVNKGMWGKSGHLGARILYMTVNGRQIRLSGAFDDKGVAGGIGAVAVSAIVFAPAGFFMTGTSAKLPVGTVVKGFIDEDVPLELAAAQLAPLTIGGSAPLAVDQSSATAGGATAPMAVGGPAKVKASTPSGFCYDVPKDYVGLGTTEKPALTSYSPACSDIIKGQ